MFWCLKINSTGYGMSLLLSFMHNSLEMIDFIYYIIYRCCSVIFITKNVNYKTYIGSFSVQNNSRIICT